MLLASMTLDHQMIYELAQAHGPLLSPQLWVLYLEQCRQRHRKPIARRTFTKYINRLAQSRLLISEWARVRGRVHLVRVNDPKEGKP